MNRPWSRSDEQYMRAWYGQIPFARIQAHLKCGAAEIHAKAESMGMRVALSDAPTDEQFNEVAPPPRRTFLNTSHSESIRALMATQPASPGPRTCKPWSPDTDAMLAELVNGGFTHAEIAVHLGRSKAAVSNRMSLLRILFPRTARNNELGRVLLQAGHFLRRGDHIAALNIIEHTIKERI